MRADAWRINRWWIAIWKMTCIEEPARAYFALKSMLLLLPGRVAQA
jgi:hypothetical protein